MGPGPHRDRRPHDRRARNRRPRDHHQRRYPRRGRTARRLHVLAPHPPPRRNSFRHERHHQRLLARHLPHVRQVRPRQQHRRCVSRRVHHVHALQPGVHDDPVVPLHDRSALQGHRARNRRARCQPLAHARRLLRANQAGHRRRTRSRDGARHHRGGDLQPPVRLRTDGPAAARPRRQRPAVAPDRPAGRRPRRSVLRLRRTHPAHRRSAARHARSW